MYELKVLCDIFFSLTMGPSQLALLVTSVSRFTVETPVLLHLALFSASSQDRNRDQRSKLLSTVSYTLFKAFFEVSSVPAFMKYPYARL